MDPKPNRKTWTQTLTPVVFWRTWHAGLLGSGVVAYLTADEDTYRMHQFSGYLFAGLIAFRLLAAWTPLGKTGPFSLRFPKFQATTDKPAKIAWSRATAFRLVRPWMFLCVVACAILVGLTGVGADFMGKTMQHLHEAIGEISPLIAALHVGVVVLLLGRFSLPANFLKRMAPVGLLLVGLVGVVALAPSLALAGPQQDGVITELSRRAKAADPAFSGFNGDRGRVLFTSKNTTNADLPSCTSCHGENLKAAGAHAKTGRAIDPMAVSANKSRLTDLELVDKRFSRDCPAVLGRPCTAQEQGDIATFINGF
jgi:cytochrome c553